MGNDAKNAKKPLRKLGALDIYQKIVKGSRTLAEVAAEYDCSYDQFLTEAKKLVGQKEWRRVERADERNSKKKPRNQLAVDTVQEVSAQHAEDAVLDMAEEPAEGTAKQTAVVTTDMPASNNIGIDLGLLEEMLGVAAFALQDARHRLERSNLRVQAAGNESREAVARLQDAELFKTNALRQYLRNRFRPDEDICKAIWEDAGQRSEKAMALALQKSDSYQEVLAIHEGIADKHLAAEHRYIELQKMVQMAQVN